MKRGSFFWLVVMSAPVLAAIGCDNISGTTPAVDHITINSISPSMATAGTATTFTLSVSYSLQTRSSGIINYSFQSGSNAFGLEHDSRPVSRGSGTLTFTVVKAPTEMNTVRVMLSEYPHPKPWSPLAVARQTVLVNSSDVRTADKSPRGFFAGRYSQPSRP